FPSQHACRAEPTIQRLPLRGPCKMGNTRPAGTWEEARRRAFPNQVSAGHILPRFSTLILLRGSTGTFICLSPVYSQNCFIRGGHIINRRVLASAVQWVVCVRTSLYMSARLRRRCLRATGGRNYLRSTLDWGENVESTNRFGNWSLWPDRVR